MVIEEEEKERERRVGEVTEEGGEAHLRGPSAVRRDRAVLSSASHPRPSREGRMLAFQRKLHGEAQRFVAHCRRVAMVSLFILFTADIFGTSPEILLTNLTCPPQ